MGMFHVTFNILKQTN